MSVKIGNGQGFWGDSILAPVRLVESVPDLDYLTLDYLAEVSLSIMAIQKEKNPGLGYARDFIESLKTLIPFWKDGFKFKIITNAGGLNPQGLAEACIELLEERLKRPVTVGVIVGDDVLHLMDHSRHFQNLDTGEPFSKIEAKIVTANAYIGAEPIVKALKQGADIVITGRAADPSLAAAACAAHYNWSFDDYDKLAGATVAGHLIECGTQATGGISTEWLSLPDIVNIAFPFVEMEEDGSFIISKPAGTGGKVDEMTVKEQLLYELGDPGRYLSPDLAVSFTEISVQQESENRVRVAGAKGSAPTESYKVSATYRDGFKAEGSLVIWGEKADEKARRAGKMILERLKREGYSYEETLVECLGMGDAVPGLVRGDCEAIECVMRVIVKDQSREAVERFTKEIASLVTCGPPGTTGYTAGRPPVREVFGFWPCLVPKESVEMLVDVIEVNR